MSYDVFISYSHIDDKTTHSDELGWVENFHLVLDKFLTEFLGRKAKIWRDMTIPGNTGLDAAIYESLDKSAVLIPILSPNFVNSSYCPQELDYFSTRKNIEHIFPVLKLPISKLPDQLSESFIKYKFYRNDQETMTISPLDPYDNENRMNFNLIVSDLAREIADFIKGIQTQTDSLAPLSQLDSTNLNEHQPTIYLAEPSPDLMEVYNIIRHVLLNQGYRLLPYEIDLIKPSDPEEFKQQVRADIKNCGLAVHLIGELNNHYPKSSNKSYLQLQTEVAAERDGDSDFKRLIWIKPNINTNDAVYNSFIEQIKSSSSDGVEIFQDISIERFKTFIQYALTQLRSESSVSSKSSLAYEHPFIYLMYDEPDLEGALKLENYIHKEMGYGVLSRGLFPENPEEKEKTHLYFLQNCSAVLIYWRSAPMPWLMQSIMDIRKESSKREQEIHRAIFIEKEKANFTPPSSILSINGYSELDNFLSRLETQI